MTQTETTAEVNRELARLLGVFDAPLTEEEIYQAISSGFLTGTCGVYQDERDVRWNGKVHTVPVVFSAGYYWLNRKGRPYQADIEAHVAAWQRPAPDYCGSLDLAFSLGEEMRKRKYTRAYGHAISSIVWGWDECDKAFFLCAHATAEQRARAALKVLQEQEKTDVE